MPEFKDIKHAIAELYYWQYGGGTNFTSMLFTLLQKADVTNRWKLEQVFLAEVTAWKMWCAAPSQTEFFNKWGLPNRDT